MSGPALFQIRRISREGPVIAVRGDEDAVLDWLELRGWDREEFEPLTENIPAYMVIGLAARMYDPSGILMWLPDEELTDPFVVEAVP